ncbi:hypothetical protein [Paenibacillus sp. J2TS4]|uniref:hypothetical protein n=1 Tax=Paenibacillus sp. J2TS4 TaxID=2807194 RepID=UPI001B1658CD|nr:hypothetical protein [Paenibacillus sp. J2TS4]GIP33484.1 hypothetical protein J2TS4_26940 [Paenibacillus sp. J2TS4]
MVDIEQYKHYRQVQVGLHSKIMEDLVHATEFQQAASILGILYKQNQIVIESYAEQDALYDFNIYETIREEKSSLSGFAENYLADNHVENELLNAMLHSETSLYEIISIDNKEGMLILRDILRGLNKSVKLVDLSLINCIQQNVLIFTRLLHLEEYSITYGLGFVFSNNHKDYILSRSRKMLKKMKTGDPSTDRFIVFFHLNRSDGIPVSYEKVE